MCELRRCDKVQFFIDIANSIKFPKDDVNFSWKFALFKRNSNTNTTRAVIGRESVLYQSTKHGAELKLSLPSANLYDVQPFLGLLSPFFVNSSESEISEQASRQKATEEPKKSF